MISLTKLNFQNNLIAKCNRDGTLVHYYKFNDDVSQSIKPIIEDFAEDYFLLFKVMSVNCGMEQNLCQKESITTFPTLKIYPQLPMPATVFPHTELTKEKLRDEMEQYIPNKVLEITSTNIDLFIGEQLNKPKVLLFTNKKEGVPFLYRALSYGFEGTLYFGIVRDNEVNLAKKYKIQAYPTLMVLKHGDKPAHYEDDYKKYQKLYNFLNIYSEIFAFKNTRAQGTSNANKPWMAEVVPLLEISRTHAKQQKRFMLQ